MQSVNSLPEALSEGRKIRGFRAGFDDNEQPASSYWLPNGDVSTDICGVVVARLPHTQEVPGSIPGQGSYLRQVSLR